MDLDGKDSFLDEIGVVLVFRVEFTVFASGKQFQLSRSCSDTRSLGKQMYWWSHPLCTVLTLLLRAGWCGRNQQDLRVVVFFPQ